MDEIVSFFSVCFLRNSKSQIIKLVLQTPKPVLADKQVQKMKKKKHLMHTFPASH